MVTRERGTVLLDSVAKRIIEQLQQDGRRSYAAIGKAIGLSEAAVRQRVQRLVEDDGGLDPRRILQRQTAALAKSGLEPVTAVELEFYVSKASSDGQFRLQTPNGLVADPDWQQLY